MRPSEIFRTSQTFFSIVVFGGTTSTILKISVLFLIFFNRIVSERNGQVSVLIWWSVRRSWIPANPSLPSFWRTKKSIRRKPIGVGFSSLFYFLFLICHNNFFFVRWTPPPVPPRGFVCRFRLGTGLASDDRGASEEVNSETLVDMNDGWSLVFTKAGWFTGAASVFSQTRRKSCGRKKLLSQRKRPVSRKPLTSISPVAARLYAFPNSSPVW